jgi:YesN/AraC family two-component response regulator
MSAGQESGNVMIHQEEKPLVLWLDPPEIRDLADEMVKGFADRWNVCFVSGYRALREDLEHHRPLAVILDCEYPTRRDLEAIRTLRVAYPPVPLLMMTMQRSVELTLWALRTRIWDFFIKPVSVRELTDSIDRLESLMTNNGPARKNRCIKMPCCSVPQDVLGRRPKNGKRSIRPALNFISAHYGERLSRNELASLCGMTDERFSRAFRRGMGCSLRDYLLDLRLRRARELLLLSEDSIGNIGCAVGFHGHAYFCRTFRKRFGSTPSDYRAKTRESTPAACPEAESARTP